MTDTTHLEPLSIDTVPGMTDEEAAFLDEHGDLKPARTERVFGTSADWIIGIPAVIPLAPIVVVGALALGAVEGARALRSALLSITPGGTSMSPARLALRQIGTRMHRAARCMAHARDVRRSQDALQHHRDQIDILRSHADAITAAQQWHARRVAIAAANLRALGVIEQMPGHPAADARVAQ